MSENAAQRFARIAALPERLCLGLMSGTSADGVDAALCRISGRAPDVRLVLLGHRAFPFPPRLRERIHGLGSVRALCELNFELGERFARAALELLESLGVSPDEVHLIGSHGQTAQHLPPFLSGTPSTLQIGEGAVIAERTGILTVCDFRVRDVAAGGQGAPLVPFADFLLFRAPGKVRVLLNIGGIANLSVIGERLEETVAFDVGPGNMVLDHLAQRATAGREPFDRDGSYSARGQVIPELLRELLDHPFLALPAPKSTGREVFGAGFSEALWQRFAHRPFDLLATAAQFTVESIRRACEAHPGAGGRIDGLFISGGGSRNPTVLEGLKRALAPVPVQRLDALGLPEEAKEAVAFALLAHACLDGTPNNVPRATGARWPVVMGKINL